MGNSTSNWIEFTRTLHDDASTPGDAAPACSKSLAFGGAPCLSTDNTACEQFVYPDVQYSALATVNNSGAVAACPYKVKFRIEPDGFFTKEDVLPPFEVTSDELTTDAGKSSTVIVAIGKLLPASAHFNLKAWILIDEAPLCDDSAIAAGTCTSYGQLMNQSVQDNASASTN